MSCTSKKIYHKFVTNSVANIKKQFVSNTLYRKLRKGNQYNALLPQSACEKVSLGKGNTDFSIEMIVKQALQHHKQVEKLAPALKAEAKTNTLQEICYRIHQFLYWHLQYKADGEAQFLRSPACAWQQRNKGVDCKSYSIFASALLLQLGIKHYIRKIKQPNLNPENYSHVYVIVPADQNSGTLQKGYYVIDGTIPTTNEPIFTQEKDFFMDKLPHYGLNGLGETQDTNETQDNTDSSGGWNFGDLFDGISLNTPISCWGGSALDENKANATIEQIGLVFENILTTINKAVLVQDTNRITYEFGKFQSILGTSVWAYHQKKSEGWNRCTTEGIARIQAVLDFYQKAVEKGLRAWLSQYFTITATGSKFTSYNKNDAHFELTDPAFYFSFTDPQIGYSAPTYTFKLKDGVTAIPAFEFTPYIEEVSTNPSSFNPQQFLDGLNTVLVTFGGSGSSGSGSSVYDNNNPTQNYNGSNTSKAGFGTAFLVLGTIGAIAYGAKHFKNKNKSKA